METNRNTRSKAGRKPKVVGRGPTKRAPSPTNPLSRGAAKKKTILRDRGADENANKEEKKVEEVALKVDKDFRQWLEKEGITIDELLSKTVKVGKLPASKQHQSKFLELTNLITELRAAGKHLLDEKNDLLEKVKALEEQKDVIQSTKEIEKTESTAAIALLKEEVGKLEEKYREVQSYVEKLQSYNSDLQNASKEMRNEIQNAETEKRAALENLYIAKGQNTLLNDTIGKNEEMSKTTIEGLKSKLENLEKSKESDSIRLKELKDKLQTSEETLNVTKEELVKWKSEAELYQEKTGQSANDLEKMECRKAAIESQFESQSQLLEDIRKEIMILQTQKEMCASQLSKANAKISELQVDVENKDKEVENLETKLHDAETERRKLHNTIQELKGNIRVFCRVRPPGPEEEIHEPGTSNPILAFPKEGDDNYKSGLSCLCPPAPQQPYQNLSFTFDHVFRPEDSQEAVFEEISQLVQSALDGYKVCIFAYGQTGSGKTYTMLGDKEHRGMIPLSMDQVFSTCSKLEHRGWKFAMHASMLEIYNEDYQDLLGDGGPLPGGKKHVVSHDAQGNTTVSDLNMVNVREPGMVEDLLAKALTKRSTGATLLNDRSSRSHFVFTLKIEGRNFNTEQKVQGVLNLIDLAGSERVKESGAQGVRLKEAQNINKSLSSLGDVIMALSNKTDHIPYRNSKLTWLLQPCLGKDAKTLMFVNISPSQLHCHESLCSLRFAGKVNACEIGVAKRTISNNMK